MATDIRCAKKKHAVLRDSGLLEIKCDSRFCGARPGVVVLHVFRVDTGELVQTDYFKDPFMKRGEPSDAAQHNPASVRTP